MAEITLSSKPLAVSPLKVSQAMGASLAFLGLARAMPLEHGARGCTALSKLFFMRHFREPIALQTTAMEQLTAVLGADDNVVEALRTVCVKDRPEIIGLITTGLSEMQGADIPRTLKAFRSAYPEWDSVAVVPVGAPDRLGCLESGFAAAVEAMITALVPSTPVHLRRADQVNLLVSPMLTTGDIEALKEWIEAFGLTPIVLPDLAASLDGHMLAEGFSTLTYGGTPLSSIGRMNESAATLVVGPSLDRAADALRLRTGTPDYRFAGVMGLEACDAFTNALRRISGHPVPVRIERQRAQLLDAMVDCHFVVGAASIAVAADPDLLGMLAHFLTSMGASVAVALASSRTDALSRLPVESVVVGDLEDLEDRARSLDVNLIIANSHAVQTAARLGLPLLRAGFPQHDYFGGHARVWAGYRGTRQALFDIANALSMQREQLPPYHSPYRQDRPSAG